MATTNQYLKNAITRHAIFVNRFSGSQLKEMLPYLERVKARTAGKLAVGELTDLSGKRLNALYSEISGVTNGIYTKMGKKLQGNMADFAKYEREFNKKMLDKATVVEWNVPTQRQIKAAVFSDPIPLLAEQGLNVEDLLTEFSAKKSVQLVQTIQDGVIAGDTNADIIKRMSFITDTTMATGLEALVRTVTKHVSRTAMDEFVAENADIVHKMEWSAMLDSSTCEACGYLDGKLFDVGEVPADPHFGCRCNAFPVVDKEFSIKHLVEGLTRPAIGADGVELDVPLKQNYGEWLKGQPASFQDVALGATKGALFRDGGLSLSRFVDHNYQPINIKDLKASDDKHIISAFKKAGLD